MSGGPDIDVYRFVPECPLNIDLARSSGGPGKSAMCAFLPLQCERRRAGIRPLLPSTLRILTGAKRERADFGWRRRLPSSGSKKLALAHRLEPRQSSMRVDWPGPTNAPPADEAARSIAADRSPAAHVSIGHRRRIVRNPRSRAAAGTGQDEEPPMPVNELLEDAAFGHEAKPPL
jgi:hypothetical protein